MTEEQARKLKVGDKVIWKDDTLDMGTVIDIGYHAATIKWEDGEQIGQVDFRGFENINLSMG